FRSLALAGKARELVDCRDDERRREPVDLLVDRQDRKPFAAVAHGERAVTEPVAAVHVDAGGARVTLDVLRTLDRGAAPRAALQLQYRQAVLRVELRCLLELLLRLLEPLGRHRRPDPEPDPERRGAPHIRVRLSSDL